MAGIQDQIKEIEEEIKNTPYNKSTQHHIGKLKAKLARLKEEAEKRKGVGVSTKGYAVKKTGDATVVIVGPPNVGKSTLLNTITGAKSEVADYGFTTLEIIPGILKFRGAGIQILDLPGIVDGASKGKGRGREILAVIRSADLILMMVDPVNHDLDTILDELEASGVRMNEKPPEIVINHRDRGGITVNSTVKLTKTDEPTVKAMLQEYGIVNADIVIRTDVTDQQLVDYLSGNKVYIPGIVAINKIDISTKEKIDGIVTRFKKRFKVIKLSLKEKKGLDVMKERIYKGLELIRVYLKPKGGKPDMDNPLILKRGDTVEKICERLHRDFKDRFRYAVITGKSAKFNDQTVGPNHVLRDEDVVTIILRR
jgi:small GTP-binding protein